MGSTDGQVKVFSLNQLQHCFNQLYFSFYSSEADVHWHIPALIMKSAFFFFKKIIFIWLHCGRWDLHCVILDLSLWHTDYGCEVQAQQWWYCGLSCSAACGILLPQPGIKPMFPELQGRFLNPGPPGMSNSLSLCKKT